MAQPHLLPVILLALTSSSYAILSFDQYAAFIQETSLNETFIKEFSDYFTTRNDLYDQKLYPNGNPATGDPTFNCANMEGHSKVTPTNVHSLRPNDIKVVAAMGDSVTAALGAGAMTLVETSLEYRGQSFSIGGDNDYTLTATVPNALRQFNPNVVGASHRVSPVWFKYFSQLNVAVSGAVAENMTDQAVELVNRIKEMKDIDFVNDWKLVTLFIGNNDVCHHCEEPDRYSATNYFSHVNEALQYLADNLPRTFVNLVGMEHMNVLNAANANSPYCARMHQTECPCATADTVNQWTIDYQSVNDKLAANYDGRDDFTVVVQPCAEKMGFPTLPDGSPDFSYLAPDCFHPSTIGHALWAKSLWNNMLQPVGAKKMLIDFDVKTKMTCPDASCPLLRTVKNTADCSAYFDATNFVLTPGVNQQQYKYASEFTNDENSDSTKWDPKAYIQNRIPAENVPQITIKIPENMRVLVATPGMTKASKFSFSMLGIVIGLIVGALCCALALRAYVKKRDGANQGRIGEKTPLLADTRDDDRVQIY